MDLQCYHAIILTGIALISNGIGHFMNDGYLCFYLFYQTSMYLFYIFYCFISCGVLWVINCNTNYLFDNICGIHILIGFVLISEICEVNHFFYILILYEIFSQGLDIFILFKYKTFMNCEYIFSCFERNFSGFERKESDHHFNFYFATETLKKKLKCWFLLFFDFKIN